MAKLKTMDIIQKILEHLDEEMDEEWAGIEPVSYQNLDISQARWSRIIAMMKDEGLIDGFIERKTLDDLYPQFLIDNPRITLKGLVFLKENSKTARVYRAAKEFRGWIPLMKGNN